jgi:glycosyltransferase involved in cell wall biosynthesis
MGFPGRLGIQQRVLPVYRVPFFEALARACQGGMALFAGQPRPEEAIAVAGRLEAARLTRTRNFQPISPGSPFYFCWQAGLGQWLEGWQPEALVIEANPRLMSTRAAVRWMRRRGRPVIGWGLGAPYIGGPPPLAGLLRLDRARFLRSLDGLIAYSQRGAAEYISQGLPADRVVVAPNAVSPRPAAPPAPRRAEVDGEPVILFVGRLQARKRIELLLHACAALPPAIQPRLWIVGDGPAMSIFQALASRVYPRAEFVGARHGADLEPFFGADLFVLPGTGGLAVQQAMAHGLPVVVAEGDGTQSNLVRPTNGWLVPPGDQQALTEALKEALSDLPRLRRMGSESYRIVAEEVNLEKMVEVFVGILNRLRQNGTESWAGGEK